jgi:TorA maturation chaperone TorD
VNVALVAADLEQAAAHRVLSIFFSTPSDDLLAELRTLAPEVPDDLADAAARASRASARDLQGLYHRVLGPSGRVPDSECAYDVNTAGGSGPLIADLAAFYRAFAYDAGGAPAEQIATELGFLGWLSLKSAYARVEASSAHMERVDQARRAFLRDHLGRWAMPFLDRLEDEAAGTRYEAIARLARETLRALHGDDAFAASSGKHLVVLDPEDDDKCG